MSCTVHDLLKLTVLSEAKIVAGEQGLKRIIRSISFMEAPDSIDWVMPHDILLTNAYLLNSNPIMKNNFINDLSLKEVAAIGIKLDRYIQQLPEEMINQANKASFPIIVLPFNVTPSQLISAIAQAIYSTKTFQKNELNTAQTNLMYDFFCDLLFTKNMSKTILLRKASSLGWDFTKSFCIMVIELDEFTYIKKIISIINHCSFNQFSFVFQYKQKIISIFEVNNLEDSKAQLERYGSEIKNICQTEIKRLNISIGMGRPYNNFLDLDKSYHEAKKALLLGQFCNLKNRIFLFDNLGIYKILSQFDKIEELEEYSKNTVTKLIQYDQDNNSEYVKTMETFMNFNGNYNETAKYLCVHYNTVKYRINVIKKILDMNVEDPDKRLDFQIGIKIANLLKIKKT